MGELVNLKSEEAQAGGPRVWLSSGFCGTEAGLLALLPDSKGAAITPEAGVQTIALAAVIATDAVVVNGTTLTFVSAGGGEGGAPLSGEVLIGETDAASATALASAIDALSGVTATASGGVVTVRGLVAAPVITSSDTTITVTDLGGWFEIPEVLDSVEVKFVEGHYDIKPIHSLHRTASVITSKGVESVTFQCPRRSAKALGVFLTQGVRSSVAAGSGQVGQELVTFDAAPRAVVYRHLIAVTTQDTGYWQASIFPKVSPAGDVSLKWSSDPTIIGSQFRVYAHEGMVTLAPVMNLVEMVAAATA